MEDDIKTFLLLSRPNYFNFLYKQDEDLVQEVYNGVVGEVESYPYIYRHNFYNFIAVHLAMKGDFKTAENYMIDALRMKPNSEVTLSNYVIMLCENEENEKVETYLEKFDDISPGLPEVKLDLATLFYLFNLNVATRKLLEEYINSYIGTNNDLALYLLGKVITNLSTGKMFHDEELETAIKIFHQIYKKSPTFLVNTEALVSTLNWKWRSNKMGQEDRSVHPYTTVIVNNIDTGNFNHAHNLFLIGKMRSQIGQVRDAKEILIKSVAEHPNANNRYHLGKCHLRLKEISSAVTQFKEAQKSSHIFNVKLVLKEATSLMLNGKRTEGLRVVNESINKDISEQEKLLLELFSAELNIVVFPEVSSTLERAFQILQKGSSRTLYRRFIRVVKLFTVHLSGYYTSSGIPHNQVEVLVRWLKFLKERGEINADQHAEFLRIRNKGANNLAVKAQNGRKSSSASRSVSRRRSSNALPTAPAPGHSRDNSVDSIPTVKIPTNVSTEVDKGESLQIKNIKE